MNCDHSETNRTQPSSWLNEKIGALWVPSEFHLVDGLVSLIRGPRYYSLGHPAFKLELPSLHMSFDLVDYERKPRSLTAGC